MVAIIIAIPTVLSAQAPLIAPRASVLFAAATGNETTLSGGILGDGSKDYRYTGFLIGGVGLGALGAYAGYGLCEYSEDPSMTTARCIASGVAGFLIAGFIGGITGAMVGGLFPKAAPAE
jgi:hypothetical protein